MPFTRLDAVSTLKSGQMLKIGVVLKTCAVVSAIVVILQYFGDFVKREFGK